MKAGPSSGKDGMEGQTDRQTARLPNLRAGAPLCGTLLGPVSPLLLPLLPNLLLFSRQKVVEPPASGSPGYSQRQGLSRELNGAAGLQRKTGARPLKRSVAQVSSVTNTPCSLPWSLVKPLKAPVRQVRRPPVLSASDHGRGRGDAGALHTQEALEGDSDHPAEKKEHVAGTPSPHQREIDRQT